MVETTYFSIDGFDVASNRCLRNVKGSRKWIAEVGENVRLADGSRESLSRPQFWGKHVVTISGTSIVPAPFYDLRFGAAIVINFPHPQSVPYKVSRDNLEFPPIPQYVWYFGTKNGKFQALPYSDPAVQMTMWVPRMTIMLDSYDTDYDDTTGETSWTITGEVV